MGIGELAALCTRAKGECKSQGAHLWGLGTSTSYRNMTAPSAPPRVSCGLVNGGCFGTCVRDAQAPGKVELHSVASAKDGMVLRFID